MHRVTGRWRLGFALALTTSICWGVLAIVLKVALQRMDAYTITWYRFAVAGVVLGVILAARGRLPSLAQIDKKTWTLLAVSLIGLLANYVLYLVALDHSTPAINQTVVQLAPLFLLIGGLVVYKERFTPLQWIGLSGLVGGLLLFFNRRLPELIHVGSGLGLGVFLVICASLMWSAYGLAQKNLLKRMNSSQVLLLLYVGAVILLFPVVRPGEVRGLTPIRLGILAFCCANTLVAYGAFVEALEHWEVSRVSAVIATAPLFTLAGMKAAAHYWPGLLEPERLTPLSVAGALLVVAGSALCAFGQGRSEPSAMGDR